MRLVLLVLVALVVTVVASPGNGSQGQPASAQTPPDQAEVTLVGPQRVVVRDLSAVPTVLPQGKEVRVIPRLTPDIEARASSGGATQAAEANVLDSAARQGLEAKAPPGISTNFEGLDDNDNVAVTGFTITPPDPQLAVGPNHIAEFVNIVGRITNKSGVPAVSDFSLASFFLVAPGSSDFDPKIIYDDIHDRFFAAYVSIDAFGDGILHLAISETSDPTGAWNLYFASYPGEFPDYPGIGVTNDKFTISYNLFNTSTFLFVGEQTLVVEKADVMAGVGGGSVGVVFFAVNPSRFTVRPAHSLSSVNDQYLTTFDVSFGLPSGALTVIRITGTPNASNVAEASATNVTTLFHDDPPPSVTAGTGDCIVRTINFGPPPCIDSGDFRMLEAIWRDNSLWSSASAECLPPGDTSVRSCAHLIEVETLGTPSVVQDIMFGASGEYFSWPAIRTDAAGNLYVSLTHSDPSTFGEARVAGRCATDPPNTMSGSSVLRAGETVHVTGRWGDYLGAAVDPSDPSAVWVLGEYAKNTGGANTDFGYWGTYVAKTSYGACPIATVEVKKDFSDDNTASVTVALVCTSGTVVNDDTTASEADPANFTVNGFTVGATCTATETVPAGYTANQTACAGVAITPGGTPSCTIVNTLNAAKPAVGRGNAWHLRNSNTAGPADISFPYGQSGDTKLMCDWDGDGVRTPGVVRGNTWHLRNSNTGGVADISFPYGQSGDTKVCGDWNGNGTETPGVVRGNIWHLRNSNTGGVADISFPYGIASDTKLACDWNGNGTDTPGVVRGNTWLLRNSNTGGVADVSFPYGQPGDTKFCGDWNGNGKDTPGVVRGIIWHLRNSNTGGVADISFPYGIVSDTQLVWK